MLKPYLAAGFEVLDLGIDVPAADIVKAAKKNEIEIVVLSGAPCPKRPAS